MKALACLTVCLLAFAGTAVAALPGKVVARKTVSGQFANVAMSATVKNPKAIYVRLIGGVENGLINVACSRNFLISSNNYTRNRAGLYRIPIKPLRADNCIII